MKKCFSILLSCVFTLFAMISCSKSEMESEIEKETTYTFRCETKIYSISGVTCYIFEYNDNNDKLSVHTIDKLNDNTDYQFTAAYGVTKVKVALQYTPILSSYKVQKWVQQTFILKNGQNTEVIISGDTIIGPREP